MGRTLHRTAALLLALLLTILAAAVPAGAQTVTVEGRTFQDGLGSQADLEGAKQALLRTVRSQADSVDLTRYGLGSDQLTEVFDQVFFENPNLFYLENGYSYGTRISRNDPNVLVVGLVQPSYYGEFTARDAEIYQAAVDKALRTLRPGMSDLDKALVLHDYLAARCGYDDTLTHYSPYHALVTGTAVCQGYLLAYSDLLNRAGVTNYPVVSQSQNHGWNAVLLDGVWYHVDVTWDHVNGLASDWVFHENFLLSDQGIQTTGELHRDWVAPGRCLDTRYEDSFLRRLRAPVLYPPEGGAYFLLEGRLCRSDDLAGLRYQVVSQAGGGQVLSPRLQAVYYPINARLAYYDGSIYYTDSVTVYRYDLTTGITWRQGAYTGGEGFLYGLSITPEGTILADVRTAPNGETKVVARLKATPSTPSGHSLVCPARNYTDVSEDQWFHEAVDGVLERGLMNGVSDSRFDPGGTTTRAMVVTILYRMEDSPADGPAVFSDVPAGAWYAAAVNWATGEGIVTGATDTSFRPDSPVTREQLAAILFRYARYKGLDTGSAADLSSYRDEGQISAYARAPLAWAGKTGLITGRSDTDLVPGGTATRAETATILMRLVGLLEEAS